jgi:amidase
VPPVPWRDHERPVVCDLRLAWSTEFPGSTTQEEIRIATENVVGELAAAGATVEEVMPDVDVALQNELGEELFDLLAGTFPAELTAFSEVANDASEGSNPLEAYLTALDRRDGIMRIWESFLADRDALILPAGTNTAERHGEEPTGPQEYPYALSAVSGCPMVAVPASIDRQGLPFGLQIIGGRWSDEQLLGVAEVVSELTGGFRQPPGY